MAGTLDAIDEQAATVRYHAEASGVYTMRFTATSAAGTSAVATVTIAVARATVVLTERQNTPKGTALRCGNSLASACHVAAPGRIRVGGTATPVALLAGRRVSIRIYLRSSSGRQTLKATAVARFGARGTYVAVSTSLARGTYVIRTHVAATSRTAAQTSVPQFVRVG
jgi:hypothetical protein